MKPFLDRSPPRFENPAHDQAQGAYGPCQPHSAFNRVPLECERAGVHRKSGCQSIETESNPIQQEKMGGRKRQTTNASSMGGGRRARGVNEFKLPPLVSNQRPTHKRFEFNCPFQGHGPPKQGTWRTLTGSHDCPESISTPFHQMPPIKIVRAARLTQERNSRFYGPAAPDVSHFFALEAAVGAEERPRNARRAARLDLSRVEVGGRLVTGSTHASFFVLLRVEWIWGWGASNFPWF